jgi:DNA-binding NarL/FixJ family response regulator
MFMPVTTPTPKPKPSPEHDPNQDEPDKASAKPVPTQTQTQVHLSPAEQQLFALLCEGLTIDQIAQRRTRRPATVANQLSVLYKKLGVNTRAQALALAKLWACEKASKP